MENNNVVIKGDIIWTESPNAFKTCADSFLVCSAGKTAGVFSQLPNEYRGFPLSDCSGKLVIPGLVDLHTHAPQFAFRALGMDLELLQWLETRAFPEEIKYTDPIYARRAYSVFADYFKKGPNTRVVVFGTVHVQATLILMQLLEESGLVTMTGRVNMDRNCPDGLKEKNAAASLAATGEWLAACAAENFTRTKPILTPRFIPSCSDELLRGLGRLRDESGLPVQSHLSENRGEIAWVKELCPNSNSYTAAYQDYGLFAAGEKTAPSVMAHCVWPDKTEIALMAAAGVFAAHCPQSNANLSSGIAPVRQLLSAGVPCGLGSDIAGGTSASIFRAMTDAIQQSKLRCAVLNENSASGHVGEKALTTEEAFYLGTASGGAFFGRAGMGYCGAFEPGYDFDALVINDESLAAPYSLTMRERLERVLYLSDERHIQAKYIKGRQII